MNNRPIQRIGDYNEQRESKMEVIFCNVMYMLFIMGFVALFIYAVLQ